MAIQSPNQLSPYAQAFARVQQEDQYVDPSIQVARDERATVENLRNELIADGVGPDTALEMAKRSNDLQKKTRVAKIQEADLALQDQEYQMDRHIQQLDQQKNYINAVSSLAKINPQSVNAKQEYNAWQGQFGNVLHGPNEAIRADAQKMATEFSSNLDANAKGVQSYLARYGLGGVPAEAVDPDTGLVNYSKIDELGMKVFEENSRKKFDEKLSQATKIAGAEQEAKFTTQERLIQGKQKDPAYQQKLALNAQRMKDTRINEIAKEEASVLSKFPKAVFSMNPKSEKDGSLVFEINKKKVPINKEEYDSAKQQLKELEAQKRAVSQAVDMELQSSEGYSATQSESPKQLTLEEARTLANELGANATRENLMDLARKRGYTF